MANMIKKSVSKATGGDSVDSKEVREEAEKYRLRVTAGPSYDMETHKPVYVNTDTATYIENDFVKAKIKVRIRGYEGLPTGSKSHSPYFDDPIHGKDQYSLGFSFVPKQDLPCEGSVWGNDFDHPVRDRLPPGFNTAFRIVKEFIDPGLNCDAYSDQPWLYGPSLSCWFAFRIGEQVNDGDDFPAPDEHQVMQDGADGSGQAIREKLGLPDNNEKRRKFFLDKRNREAFTFEQGRCYQGDFYNPYIDFSKFALKLPGFSLGVLKYIDDKSHQLRYVFKNQATGDVYLNVNFSLLFGEQLKEAMAAEEESVGVAGRGENRVEASDGDEPDDSVQEEQRNEGVNGEPSRATSNASDTGFPKTAQQAMPDGSGASSSKQNHTDEESAASEPSQTEKPNPMPDQHEPAPRTPKPPENPTQISETRESDSRQAQLLEERRHTAHVAEISDLLEGTSTSDKRGSEPFLFADSKKPAAKWAG
ncbi:hypothetical protein MBLNU230_g3071t1 [Neophaeotheca triangularis]